MSRTLPSPRRLASFLVLTIAAASSARAQAEPTLAPLRADGGGVAALRRVLSVPAGRTTVERGLRDVAMRADVRLTYSPDLPDLARTVTLRAARAPAAELLLRLVRGTALTLLVSADGGVVVAPRRADALPGVGTVQGIVQGIVRDADGIPVAGARVELDAAGGALVARTREDGRFVVREVPNGTYAVDARAIGHRPAWLAGIVVADSVTSVELTLERAAMALADMVITPSVFDMLEARAAAPVTLSRTQIETAPQLGDDIFRALARLPGVASSDFSARFRVRGAPNDELLVSLDGLQLYEPFHLKDFDGVLSIIDAGALGGVELSTGGFGVQHGDRLTGLFALRSLAVDSGPARTTLGLSVTNARAMSRGTFGGGNGRWLASVRRGYLEYMLRLGGYRHELLPQYYDAFAKAEYQLGPRHHVSAHVLRAGDQLRVVSADADEPTLRSTHGSSYGWLTWDAVLGERLRATTLVSVGALDWHRTAREQERGGSAAAGVRLDEDRSLALAGVRQDWRLSQSGRASLTWGVDARTLRARYDFASRRLSPAGFDTTSSLLHPSGWTAAAYVAQRLRPWAPLSAELGARVDRQSYTGETQVSPRASAALEVGRTTVRATLGHYAQAQGLHELQVQDGARAFAPAERSDHRGLAVEHALGPARVRVEAYDRRLRHLRPRYTNLDPAPKTLGELSDDRVLMSPASGRARGVELFARAAVPATLDWSAGYALASARDRVDGRLVPRPFDQRHTVSAYAAYAPAAGTARERWRFAAGWQWHTGWPHTPYEITAELTPGGGVRTTRTFGPHNSARFGPYHRLDLRASRRFHTRRGELLAFVDVFNAYNRKNPQSLDWAVYVDGPRVSVQTERPDAFLPTLPSFGLSWEF